jgi:hypothetical protein
LKSADVEDCDVLYFSAHGWPAVRDTARYNPSHALVDAGLLLHHGRGVPALENPGELLTLLSIQNKRLSRCKRAFIMADDGAVGARIRPVMTVSVLGRRSSWQVADK